MRFSRGLRGKWEMDKILLFLHECEGKGLLSAGQYQILRAEVDKAMIPHFQLARTLLGTGICLLCLSLLSAINTDIVVRIASLLWPNTASAQLTVAFLAMCGFFGLSIRESRKTPLKMAAFHNYTALGATAVLATLYPLSQLVDLSRVPLLFTLAGMTAMFAGHAWITGYRQSGAVAFLIFCFLYFSVFGVALNWPAEVFGLQWFWLGFPLCFGLLAASKMLSKAWRQTLVDGGLLGCGVLVVIASQFGNGLTFMNHYKTQTHLVGDAAVIVFGCVVVAESRPTQKKYMRVGGLWTIFLGLDLYFMNFASAYCNQTAFYLIQGAGALLLRRYAKNIDEVASGQREWKRLFDKPDDKARSAKEEIESSPKE